jgi:cytochrome c oxidase subunit 1
MQWGTLNLVATIGTFVSTVGGVVFVANAVISLYRGAPAGADPWGGPSLEWATSSPPPSHNFDATPIVESLAPLWDAQATLPVMTGLSASRRQVLVTSVVEAVPQYLQRSPEPSIWPLIAALGVTILFIGSIFTPWALIWGAIPVGLPLIAWFWPQRPRATTGPLRKRSA